MDLIIGFIKRLLQLCVIIPLGLLGAFYGMKLGTIQNGPIAILGFLVGAIGGWRRRGLLGGVYHTLESDL